MSDDLKQSHSRYRTIRILVLSLIAILGLLLGARSIVDYRWEVRQFEERLMAQARVVDENLTANLSTASLALEYVKHELTDIPSHQFDNFLKGQCDRMPGVRSFLVIDGRGRVLHSNRKELVDQDFSKRDFFTTTRNAPDKNMLFLSPPFKSVLGPDIMTITKPITGKLGEFTGVITVSLSQEYFQTLLKSTIFAPDNRIALIHSDGTVFTAIPDDNNSVVGRNLMKPGSLMYRHMQEGKATSIQSGRSAATADYRVFAYITNSSKTLRIDKHFIVAASRNLNEVLARWRFSYVSLSNSFTSLFPDTERRRRISVHSQVV
jgi:Cache domain